MIGTEGRNCGEVGAFLSALVSVLLGLVLLLPGAASGFTGRAPVVFFPGYGTTIMRVTVRDQTSVTGCPRSGSFEDGLPANVGTTFGQVCRDRLITPRWRTGAHLSFPQRFSLPSGVKVTIPNYGKPVSAPVYAPFYAALEAAGYTAGRDLVVAVYDFPLTPVLAALFHRSS